MRYYIILFFGTFFAGDSFIFPGVYLGLKGTISLLWFFIIVITATLLSDALWYLLGRFVSLKKIRTLPFLKNKQKIIDKIIISFEKHDAKILLLSKFIYGTRIITQIFFGSVKYSFSKYLLLNFLIIFVWLSLITTIALATKYLLEMTNINLSSELTIVLVLLIIIIIYIWTKNILNKKKYL